MPPFRLTVALFAAVLALFAGAFAVGRAVRSSGSDGTGSAAQTHVTELPATGAPPAVPRLAKVSALPALRVHHTAKKQAPATSADSGTSSTAATPNVSTGSAAPSSSTGATSHPTAKPSPKKPSGGSDPVSSGGNSLGG